MEIKDANSNRPIMKRDNHGNFAKGNQEGNRFQVGHPGKPKGAKNKKNKMIKEIAADVLKVDPYSGEEMTYKEYVVMLKWWALTNARIGEWFLNHGYGRPVETVQQEQRILIMPPLPEREEPKQIIADVVDIPSIVVSGSEEQESLPEDEE